MPYKVFISSARRDIDLARDLAQRLEKAGVNVLLPAVSSEAGDDFAAKINSDLRKADEVIVILTPNSLDSKWLLFEMGVATSLDKQLTPLVQGVEPKELPPIIKQMKYVKYADLERYISKLKQRINALAESTRS
ncbi:MAG TPA: toll/interleukin-1 receptor domain-containing protein [Pyrinomonadaceae bacterium]|jgi:nucleoside 2-deoxyribosyltransferase